ncbi:MAG: Ig-like domain-containing protein [Ruminococcus sp. SR1/5]|nr:Ig-like domain-containing protein [Ruminococcus sp.]
MKKRNFIALVFVLMFVFSLPVYAATGNAAKYIKLNKAKITMYVTESTTIKATCSTGKLNKVAWKSSNTKIATVKNGVVTAKKPGTVTITASSSGMKKNCRITVKGDWYQKVLKASNKTYRVKRYFDGKTYAVSLNDFDYYRLIDINKDGIKELMLYRYPKMVFFTYYKGKVTPVLYDDWVRGVYLKGSYLTIQHGTSSENTCYVYTLKNGKLRKSGEYFHTTSSAYPVPIYKINGKKCSKNTFFKAYDRYMKNATYLM